MVVADQVDNDVFDRSGMQYPYRPFVFDLDDDESDHELDGMDYFLKDLGFSSWADAMQNDHIKELLVNRGKLALIQDDDDDTKSCPARIESSEEMDDVTLSDLAYPMYTKEAESIAAPSDVTDWIFEGDQCATRMDQLGLDSTCHRLVRIVIDHRHTRGGTQTLDTDTGVGCSTIHSEVRRFLKVPKGIVHTSKGLPGTVGRKLLPCSGILKDVLGDIPTLTVALATHGPLSGGMPKRDANEAGLDDDQISEDLKPKCSKCSKCHFIS